MIELTIPDFSLLVLIGASGAGKSTFASRWFAPTEIVSSDRCRALISDNQDDQTVSADAFGIARDLVDRRLKHRRLTVVDATNTTAAERRHWVEIARRRHAQPVAIVLDPGLDLCIARNAARPERGIGPEVPRRMVAALRQGLHKLTQEGFRQVVTLDSATAIDAAVLRRVPLPVDQRHRQGPFDIVGDVHGCLAELEALMARLGYAVAWIDGPGGRWPRVTPPGGRTLVFAGDLVDRGPATPDVIRLAIAMTEAGCGLAVQGNHDDKLARWLAGRTVNMGPGLQASIDQIAGESNTFRETARAYLTGLPSHLWLDDGRLAVAHAGLTAEMVGRDTPSVTGFARFGETTGGTDAHGLPVRGDWMSGYQGAATIVYGHTPMATPRWIGDTLCIDTGCVFGGTLTALRWPERTLVSVPATRTYMASVRPLDQG